MPILIIIAIIVLYILFKPSQPPGEKTAAVLARIIHETIILPLGIEHSDNPRNFTLPDSVWNDVYVVGFITSSINCLIEFEPSLGLVRLSPKATQTVATYTLNGLAGQNANAIYHNLQDTTYISNARFLQGASDARLFFGIVFDRPYVNYADPEIQKAMKTANIIHEDLKSIGIAKNPKPNLDLATVILTSTLYRHINDNHLILDSL
jgi:hypothetical protein